MIQLNLIFISNMSYYSGSLTKSRADNTSPNRALGMKLLPSGSYDLNTLRAVSHGVSGDTSRFSLLNKTGGEEMTFIAYKT